MHRRVDVAESCTAEPVPVDYEWFHVPRCVLPNRALRSRSVDYHEWFHVPRYDVAESFTDEQMIACLLRSIAACWLVNTVIHGAEPRYGLLSHAYHRCRGKGKRTYVMMIIVQCGTYRTVQAMLVASPLLSPRITTRSRHVSSPTQVFISVSFSYTPRSMNRFAVCAVTF